MTRKRIVAFVVEELPNGLQVGKKSSGDNIPGADAMVCLSMVKSLLKSNPEKSLDEFLVDLAGACRAAEEI